jgi:hypothetical protein
VLMQRPTITGAMIVAYYFSLQGSCFSSEHSVTGSFIDVGCARIETAH